MARVDGYVRLVQKALPQSATPSVPLSDDHTDGTWVYTDLYDREIAINDAGDFFYRSDNTIYQLGSGTGSGGIGATGATGANGYRAVMNLSYTGSSLVLSLGQLTLPIGTPINNLGWQQGTRVRVWHSSTEYMEGQVTTIIANPQTVGIDVDIDYVVGSGTFVSWYVGIAGDLGSGGTGGATPSLAQVLAIGNTSGANDIIFDTTQGIYFNNTSRLREGTIDAGYGGAKGIAQICSIGYEMKWESGSLYIMDNNGTHIREVRYTFGATPAVTDDDTKGFTIGSRWVLDNGDIYTCSDITTGAAVWTLEVTTQTLEQTLQNGNTIGAESINFGGGAYIDATGTSVRMRAGGNVSGDSYLNSLIVYDDLTSGIEQISYSSVTGVDNTSSIQLTPGQTYEAHTISDIVVGTNQTTVVQRTPEKTVELLTDQSTGVDTEYRRELGVNGTTNGSLVKVKDNNSLEETQIKTDKSTITLSSSAASGQILANIGITASEITYSIVDTDYYDPHYSAIGTIGTQYTSLGNDYISPNPGFPDFHRRGSVNTKSAPASGNQTWAELWAGNVDDTSVSYIRATDMGGAYPANVFYVGGSSGYYSQIEQGGNNVILSSSNPYFEGIKYDQDWSANFVNRSLVDKEYVDGAISGGAQNLSSVLTTGNTSGSNDIIFNNTYGLKNSSGEGALTIDQYSIDSYHLKVLNGAGDTKVGRLLLSGNVGRAALTGEFTDNTSGLYSASVITADPGYAQMAYQESNQVGTINYYATLFQVNRDNLYVASTINSSTPNTAFKGIEYGDNYSANFTTRSLVDKAYVDNAVTAGGGGGTVSQILTQVRNQSGATMHRGKVVYISGSTGTLPLITLSQANSESTSARTYGIVRDDIANNGTGYVVAIGAIQNLDTRTTATNPFTSNTLADGNRLYLSPTTPGYVTNVKPSAPNHLVYIGTVIRTSPTAGYIEYQIQNGYELDELHDVSISTTPTDGQVLTYESATSLWKPTTVSSATPNLTQVLTQGNTASTSIDMNLNNITGISSLGNGGSGTTMEVINMINASLLTLMYNT